LLLLSLEDFEGYKNKLDEEMCQHHNHYGEPKKYPCKVYSEWIEWNQSELYDEYHHKFIYLMDIVCPDCGHKTQFWPEIDEEFFK